MTTLDVVENKISSIEKYLQILEQYRQIPLDKMKDDLTVRGAVERYLYLAAQATIDLGEAIISLKQLRKPTVYSEIFQILEEQKFISHELAERLVRMAGFRNVIAHDYEKVNFDIIYKVLQERLGDIQEFIKEVKNKFRI